ncbi:MAG: alpha/beta hydrolase [Actinomycetes bacterium]
MRVIPGAEAFSSDVGKVGVVLCHGFTGTPASLRPWAEHLTAAGYSVRVPRLAGHGTTWRDLNRTTWHDWYSGVDRAFRDLDARCDAVAVGGLSMGGALALRLAQEHGRRVAGLVLVNPAVLVENRLLFALPALRHVVPSFPGIASDIRKPGQVEVAYDRTPLHAVHSMLRMYRQVVRDLPHVRAPLLLLRSTVDHVVPAASSALVLSRVSSSDVEEVLLEDSYHVATQDHDAERIFDLSARFVARVTAATGPADTGSADTGSADTVAADTVAADPVAADSISADTVSAELGRG